MKLGSLLAMRGLESAAEDDTIRRKKKKKRDSEEYDDSADSVGGGLVLLVPQKRLKKKVRTASREIAEYFDGLGPLEKITVKKALRSKGSLSTALTNLIARALANGYEDAGGLVTDKFVARIEKMAQARADKVAAQMARTTAKKAKAGSSGVLSVERATRAAKYEATKAYYQGVKAGYGEGSGMGKEWICGGDNPCGDCLDAEDEGQIPIEDDFENGFAFPPSHLHCQCFIALSPLE